jgi:hypothetical protein
VYEEKSVQTLSKKKKKCLHTRIEQAQAQWEHLMMTQCTYSLQYMGGCFFFFFFWRAQPYSLSYERVCVCVCAIVNTGLGLHSLRDHSVCVFFLFVRDSGDECCCCWWWWWWHCECVWYTTPFAIVILFVFVKKSSSRCVWCVWWVCVCAVCWLLADEVWLVVVAFESLSVACRASHNESEGQTEAEEPKFNNKQ